MRTVEAYKILPLQINHFLGTPEKGFEETRHLWVNSNSACFHLKIVLIPFLKVYIALTAPECTD